MTLVVRSYRISVDPLPPVGDAASLHQAMRCVLVTAQCFGVMPVYGLTEPHVNRLQFRWRSLRTAYSALLTVGLVFNVLLFVAQFFYEGEFGNIVAVVFFLLQSTGYMLFLQLARNWATLASKWQQIDVSMRGRYEHPPNLQRRFQLTTVVFLSLALVEHLLCVAKAIRESHQCAVWTSDPLKAFFSVWSAQLFRLTVYTHWKAFLIEIPTVTGTFHWNFLDLFIVLVSAALAERFRQINRRVQQTAVMNEYFWREIREDYSRLWSMCQTLNDDLCHLVSLSFAGNLFFICWQMFNTLKPITGIIQTVYFAYSFGYLIGRTVTVALYCCWIHDESKEMLAVLFNLTSQFYGPEADRLIQQICAAPAALSGSNSFLITRDFCLQVAGVIITFELILLQVGPSYLETDKSSLFCLT